MRSTAKAWQHFTFSLEASWEVLSKIRANGEIAVLEYDGKGRCEIYPMSSGQRTALRECDLVTQRWIDDQREHGRVFVIWGKGTMLLNMYADTVGFWVEPGSRDIDRN